MLRVPSIKELTYRCKQCGFTNIKRKSISANPESWGVSRGITQTGSYSLATPTPDTFDYEVLSDGQANAANHILNSNMEVWTSGASAAPDSWTYAEVGAGAVAREGTIIHDGAYSAKLTTAAGAGSVATLEQKLDTTLGIAYWQGKTITFGASVYTDGTLQCLSIADDVSTTVSSYCDSGKTWAWTSVTKTIDLAATYVILYLITQSAGSAQTAYFDNAILVEGSTIYHNNKISFTAATSSTPAKINHASSGFADLGFVPGDTIIISTTSGTNDGTYTLATRGGITNGSLSLSSADSLTTESANAAGTVTLSIRTYKPNITTGCSFCGSLNSR